MNNPHFPNIYNYSHVTEYLLSCLNFEKMNDPSFSVRKWAKKMGIDSTLLSSILQGKKQFSSVQGSKFSEAYLLDSSEDLYLEVLIKKSSVEKEKEKKVYDILLTDLRMHTGVVRYVEDQSIFSHWVHMAIISMSRMNGFLCTVENIKNSMIHEVSETLMDEAIERLLRLELIKIDTDGIISKRNDIVTSRNDVLKKTPHTYFEQVSDLAKISVAVPADQREFQCFSIAIDNNDMPAFKDMIRNFRSKISTFSDSGSPNQLYQMNIQFFPLSKETNSAKSHMVNEPIENSI